ncbi:MAG: hypothetical protein K2N29_07445 [Ruminiclostridium sp.]|nr:hypothetical protein [Ruminiclostridium sp.]
MTKTSCDRCSNYVYNDDFECYQCEINLDEDEMYRYLSDSDYACPYYRDEDDYFLARKQ